MGRPPAFISRETAAGKEKGRWGAALEGSSSDGVQQWPVRSSPRGAGGLG